MVGTVVQTQQDPLEVPFRDRHEERLERSETQVGVLDGRPEHVDRLDDHADRDHSYFAALALQLHVLALHGPSSRFLLVPCSL
jgi:hypothetical protein